MTDYVGPRNLVRFALAIGITFQTSCGALSSGGSETVEFSIGKLIISHDQKFSYETDLNPFGSSVMYVEFEEVYFRKVAGLDIDERIDFLWASMWHLNFDGHSMEEFQFLVAKDCGEEFVARLDNYVEQEIKLQRSKDRLFLSKQVLLGLRVAVSELAETTEH